ncbi:MAG: dihydrolipoamide acetyltransferase family protein [FCB group bacterium]|jgi:pyruvate dehydrogenase E2 component (dihydrolipoamide acetyltransferase)|nr:dihydrolipoamide acetyltransferase family protein [FCB group bacterium]
MHEIKMPQMGQSVEEASIVQWLKKEGERVEKGDPIASIQTDKAEIEYESPESGILRKIVVPADELVPVMTVIALIGEADEALPEVGGAPAAAPSVAAATATASTTSTPSAASPPAPVAKTGAAASPRAKAKAAELNADLSKVAGSGVGGRIMEADVVAQASAAGEVRATPTAKRVAEMQGVDLGQVAGSGPRGKVMKADVLGAAATPPPAAAGDVKRTPLSPMRRIIAQRMAESLFTAPHYYVTVEVDMAAAASYRSAMTTFKPSYNDLVIRATARALQKWPQVNVRWCGDAVEEVADINLGFAVALPTGLIVPVVRRAQDKSLQDINRECRELTEKARVGKLLPDDYQGNTFTISNLGGFGVDHFTAIINQPDSAILAVGQIKDRPVVIDGGIHVRPIMKLTLSSDHRVIDGALAAQFMGTLKQILESADF